MGDFLMPMLGADMEAGTLVEWRIKPGDTVKRGDVVATVETAKGLIEVEIWEDGTVDTLLVEPGTQVPVGTALARVRGAGVAASPQPSPVAAPTPIAAPKPVTAAPPPSPPASAPSAEAAHVRASPVAKRMAKELGVDLAQVHGTGPGGAITQTDVTAFAAARPATPVAAPATPAPAAPAAPAPGAAPQRQQTTMRQAIAAAMARSKREIPHYYLGTHIDMRHAVTWLHNRNASLPITDRLLPIAVLLKAVGVAAREFPDMNGRWAGDHFEASPSVNVGCAISLRQGGLVAPALHDVDRMKLEDLMREFNDLVARARAGRLRSSELADGTLTVTSLGDRGAEAVYGIIFPPQVALVGFGRIVDRPWCVDGHVEARPVVEATLAADHRASDGHRGGLFLERIERLLQEPEKL